MAKVLSGILTAGDGTALANQSIKIVAINSTPPGVIKGAESVFITDGVGAYSVTMQDGSYRVTAESASGGDIALGNILVQGLDPSDLPTLLALSEEPGRPVDDALQALADAAATSAQEAADSAASVNPSNFIAVTEKGAANGVAELGGDGKVPSSQLPSYVDDVLEYADFASLPVTGETGKIYVTLDDNKTFRWSGSVYVEISSLDAGEVKTLYESNADTNAFTDAEKTKLSGLEDLSPQVFTAHGKIDHPSAQDDFDCPATVANEFTVKAASYRINDSVFSLADTAVTLPAAPATSALLSRKDLVYLKENQTFVVFEGASDAPTMTDAGFSPVAGEAGLWFDGVDYAVPVTGVQRRNQGAYHKYFNEFGCSRMLYESGAASSTEWYTADAKTPFSIADCFELDSNANNTAGNIAPFASNQTGAIGGNSGRPDDKFYDSIYLSDITDLRLQANAPTAIQLAPNYIPNKVIAGQWKNYVTEGIPVTVVKERGVVEGLSSSTTNGALVSVGDPSLYEIGSHVTVLTEQGRHVTSGFVAEQIAPSYLRLRTTKAAAIDNLAEDLQPINRVNGDIYTILKVEYTTATGSENTWTDIIGDPANYPRQAFGLVDHLSSGGSVTVETGMVVQCIAGFNSGGVPGDCYSRIGANQTSDLAVYNYGSTTNWLHLGPLATYQANAKGLEGFPLLYGENGEDYIPDGNSNARKLSRKFTEYLTTTYSTDKGVSWGTESSVNNSTDNTVTIGGIDNIVLISYKTPAKIWTPAVNSAVLDGQLSDVMAYIRPEENLGSVFVSDMIGKVSTQLVNGVEMEQTPLTSVPMDVRTNTLKPDNNFTPLAHKPLELAGGDSPAAKAVFYKSGNAGEQVKLHALFKEMIYDSALDNVSEFISIDGTTSQSYTAGNLYRVTGLEQDVAVYCVTSITTAFTDTTPDGNGGYINNDGALWFTAWNGSGFGDDNEFNVVNNVATAVDDNGNTVLIGTKSTITPWIMGNK